MSTNHHTPITTGAARTAAVINAPLSQLDTKISSLDSDITALEGNRARIWAGKTTAPTVNDDSGDGYSIGDRWIDETNNKEYVCLDDSVGAAVWTETTSVAITPDTDTRIDGLKLIWNSATSISVGTGQCYAENDDLIDVTSALTASSLSLSNSTWYHVYVYLSSGTPAVEVVTTAPTAWKGTAYSKTGDTSRRYVGSVRTDGSGNVYEFLHSAASGMMLYSGDCDLDASPFRALNAGTATTATAVDLSAVVPVTSRVGYMRLLSTGTVIVSFGPTSNVTGAALGVGSSTQTSFLGQFPLTTSQQYYYKFASAPTGGAYIDVYGYVFER